MKKINKYLIAFALVILGTLDLSKDIIGDLVHSLGFPEYSIILVKVIGFLLTAYVAQQTTPIRKRTKQNETQL